MNRDRPHRSPRIRFTLGQVMAWTAGVAVVLGGLIVKTNRLLIIAAFFTAAFMIAEVLFTWLPTAFGRREPGAEAGEVGAQDEAVIVVEEPFLAWASADGWSLPVEILDLGETPGPEVDQESVWVEPIDGRPTLVKSVAGRPEVVDLIDRGPIIAEWVEGGTILVEPICRPVGLG
jgi:hypothetical protein